MPPTATDSVAATGAEHAGHGPNLAADAPLSIRRPGEVNLATTGFRLWCPRAHEVAIVGAVSGDAVAHPRGVPASTTPWWLRPREYVEARCAPSEKGNWRSAAFVRPGTAWIARVSSTRASRSPTPRRRFGSISTLVGRRSWSTARPRFRRICTTRGGAAWPIVFEAEGVQLYDIATVALVSHGARHDTTVEADYTPAATGSMVSAVMQPDHVRREYERLYPFVDDRRRHLPSVTN